MKVNGEWSGYCIDLIKALQKLINFDYELYEAPDGQYGRIDENLEWDGAVKELVDQVKYISCCLITSYACSKISMFSTMLIRWNAFLSRLQNADIILGAFAVMAERESVIDYTVPYYDLVGTSILMKKVKTDTSLFKFLSVLEGSVWGCILAAYFVTRYAIFQFSFLSIFTIILFFNSVLFCNHCLNVNIAVLCLQFFDVGI